MKVNALIAALLAVGSMSAQAAPAALTGASNFVMLDSLGGYVGGAPAPTLTGFIDLAAMTWNVASTTAFFGGQWTASGGVLYNPGTYTVNVNGDGANAVSGTGDVTFTVGAGQIGGNINFAWGPNTGIDVFNVWNVSTAGGFMTLTSSDVDGNGILGLAMIDGAFPGMSANFNMTAAVPEPETYAMLLAGLGLVGFAARRRKTA